MAYGTKYQAKWIDIHGTVHQIDILEDSYSGGITTISDFKGTPVNMRRRSSKTDGFLTIVGTELTFSFISSPSDIATYDAIFESEFKDYRVDFYVNSSLEFRGFLLPENFSRDYVDNGANYVIKLTATDGLARLKNIEYADSSGLGYTDRVSLITHIKRILTELDFVDNLDFMIQLNTYATNSSLMTSTQCALDKVTAESRRFEKDDDGRKYQDNCYAVLEEILKPFNCTLMQSGGKWWIVNYQEPNSKVYSVPWTTLTFPSSPSTSDLRIDGSSLKFQGRGSTEKLRPLETVGVKFQDRNLGDSLFDDGGFDTGTADWNQGTGLSYFARGLESGNYYLDTRANSPTTAKKWIYSDTETITGLQSGDKLKIKFRARAGDITYTGGVPYQEAVQIRVNLYQDDGDTPIEENGVLFSPLDINTRTLTEGEDWMSVEVSWSLPVGTENYRIRIDLEPISILSESDYTDMAAEFDDFELVVVYSGVDITFDRYYGIENTDSNNIDSKELKIKFGDSVQDSDVGAFKVGTTRTSSWNRYGKTENISIQQLCGQNLLESYASYKNSSRVKIVDINDSISPHNCITIDSIDYKMIGFSVSFNSGGYKVISAELEELLTGAVTSTTTLTPLDTVDGKDTGTENLTSALLILDDGNTSTASTWSSSKIDSEITAAKQWLETGNDLYYTAGNIGINTTPSNKLTVKSDTTNSTTVIAVQRSTGVDVIRLNQDSSGRGYIDIRNASGVVQNRIYGGSSSYFLGDVGFGTSSPSTGFIDIVGKTLRTRAGGSILSRQGTAGVAQTLLNCQNSTGGARCFVQQDSTDTPTFTMRNASGSNRIFLRPDSDSYMSNNTKLMIGHSTEKGSVFSFEVTGNVDFTGYLQVGNATGGKILYDSPTSTLQFGSSGNAYIDNDDDSGYAADWIATSDRRLKTNIEYDNNWSNLVEKVGEKTVRFNWIGGYGSARDQIGFIAQDIFRFMPEVVSVGGRGHLGISYDKMIAPLYSAVSQLIKENRVLREDIKKLKEKI